MSSLIARRATNETQKEAKRDAILIGARAVFSETGFWEASMAMIAKRSGLAKGTVYLYFNSKEEIFLSLTSVEIEAWLDMVDRQLLENGPCDIDGFIDLLLVSMEGRDSLIRLLTLLHLVLENNVTYEAALTFKQNLGRRTLYTGSLVETALGFLQPGQGVSLLLNIHCLVVGWGQMSNPAPVLKDVLERPEMAPFRVDFKESIRMSLTALLTGYKQQNRPSGLSL